MAHQRRDGETEGRAEGPLDELAPGWRRVVEPVSDEPVHPRVLVVDEEDGRALVLVCWRDPGGPKELHEAVRRRLEAALLAELSRPAPTAGDVDSVRLAVFADLPYGCDAPLRAFGLRPADPRDPRWRQTRAHLRGEAQQIGRRVDDDPITGREVRAARLPAPGAERVRAVEAELRAASAEEAWGERPGAPCHRLLGELGRRGSGPIEPTLQGLDQLERCLIPAQEDVLRWVPPLCFQALCDAVGVVAHVVLGHEVQWAVCEPDADGLAPPPLLRLGGAGAGAVHLPVGLALLRWCIMPLQPGERVPPLSEWLVDQVGSAG